MQPSTIIFVKLKSFKVPQKIMSSLEELIEEAKERAKKRLENLKYDDELLKWRLGKYYNLLLLAVETQKIYGSPNTPYVEIDFSNPYFSLWLVEDDKRKRIYGKIPYGAPAVRTLLTTLNTYAKEAKDRWMDFDELKEKTSKHPKVSRREVTNLFQRTKTKEIFEIKGEKVKLKYPIGNVKIV